MEIDGEKLKKDIANKEIERLRTIQDDDKDMYIRAYSDGVYDAIELLIEHIDEQLKEK